jgi:hypothetical protein
LKVATQVRASRRDMAAASFGIDFCPGSLARRSRFAKIASEQEENGENRCPLL